MIVIPMAGQSLRFRNAGYTIPKYMLTANGKSLFSYSMTSFKKYFNDLNFLFIARNIFNTEEFIKEEINKIGIKNFTIIIIDEITRGQAETVFIGLNKANIDPNSTLSIFNIDTFRQNFILPSSLISGKIDGFIEVFLGEGTNWSFIKPKSIIKKTVLRTSEKIPISNLCCTGLYSFKNVKLYNQTYLSYFNNEFNQFEHNERYIAPMYNLILDSGGEIRYKVVKKNNLHVFGTPDEFNNFKKIASKI